MYWNTTRCLLKHGFSSKLYMSLILRHHGVALLFAGLQTPPQLPREVSGAADVEAVLTLLQGHLHVHPLLDQLSMSVGTSVHFRNSEF